MKLLLLNWQDRLNPQAGGAEIFIHEVFGRLARAGHHVTLLAAAWPGCVPRETVDGMEVHRVGSRYGYGLAAPRYFRRHLADRGFDLAVESLSKVPVFTPRWAGIPVVLHVHHLFGLTAFREASVPVAAATWLLERPIPAVYRGLHVEAVSHSTADDLASRGLSRERIRVIHPGVDLGFFTPAEPRVRAPVPTFLYLGRLKRYKRVDLILRAVARLRHGGREVRLVVGGKGEWEPRLRGLALRLGIAEDVDFAGFVSEEEKRRLFREAWANVLTSPKEGWGISNLEAAACGTATVASDAPGLRESVVDGDTGLLVPHGDVAALAGAMERMAADRSLTDALGAGAYRFARDFSWDRAASETAEHLEQVLRAGHGGHAGTHASR